MTALSALLDTFRTAGKSERERGTYFEELIVAYLRTEPLYRDLYATVEPYAACATRRGLDRRDAGIDLVPETVGGEVHAIQCKLYAAGRGGDDHPVREWPLARGGEKAVDVRLLHAVVVPWGELARKR